MSKFRIPTDLSKFPIDKHQKQAVECTVRYLNRQDKRPDELAALVQMPTGSGKTGIIAILAHLCRGINRTLVVAPRTAIRDQLRRKIGGEFFVDRGMQPPSRRVAFLSELLLGSDPIVLVATVQQVDTWRRTSPAAYAKLAKCFDLIVMDEGHYEPAASWSKSIRGLETPTLLLTATPYRNDLKTFQLDPQAISTLRFDNAVKNGTIRDVRIHRRPDKPDAQSFVVDVLKAFRSLVPKSEQQDARILIRCNDSGDIRRMCTALRAAGEDPVGIHEQFDDRSGHSWLKKTVPAPDKVTAKIWVHQYKLLEGIDDARFRVVAVYGTIGSVRQLIQQVGRVLRNPTRKVGQSGFLLDHHSGALEYMWDQFLTYDRTVTPEGLARPIANRTVDAIAGEFKTLEYIDREFRRPFSFSTIGDPLTEFKLPLEVHVFRKSAAAKGSQLEKWIVQALIEGDCRFQRLALDPAGERIGFVYVSVANSPYLTDSYFLEPELGLVVASVYEDKVAFVDTGGLFPLGDDNSGVQGTLPQRDMGRAIRDGRRSRVSIVSTRNSSVSRGTIRARSVSAASLAETALFPDDFQHVVTSVTGYSDETNLPKAVRRYVGFVRGRLTEAGKSVPLKDYLAWTDQIVAKVSNRHLKSVPIISRFSQELNGVPHDPTPVNVLFDLSEAERLYVVKNSGASNGDPLETDDVCLDCLPIAGATAYHRRFELEANGQTIGGEIRFDTKRGRYLIASPKLDELYEMTTMATGKVSLCSWLNRYQAFNVVPQSSGAIFVQGRFYDPGIATGAKFDPAKFVVGSVIEAVPALTSAFSEKGTQCRPNGAGWEAGSLFDLIDTASQSSSPLASLVTNPDILVCDDLNNEVCDFLLSDSNGERVVMIHAKAARKPKPLSAGALHEVAAQAIKHSHFLSMLNVTSPPNLLLWAKPWTTGVGKAPSGKVDKRIRLGPPSPAQAWQTFETRVKNPKTVREVWLVLGGMLSKTALETDLAKSKPSPQSLHIVHLLSTTIAAVASTGARLRVLSSP